MGHGEGEAGQDRRQGFPREGPQGRVLRASWSGGEPCDEAPRVLLHFPPLAPRPPPAPPPRPPPSSRRFYSLLLLSRLAGGCVVKHGFRSQAALRGRSHVFHPCLAEQ